MKIKLLKYEWGNFARKILVNLQSSKLHDLVNFSFRKTYLRVFKLQFVILY
jgi:hypothetical protein